MIMLAMPAFFFAMAPDLHAKSMSPAEALEILRSSFSRMNDFTAEITQEKQLSLMKKKITAKGMVRFRKPESFYMELFPPLCKPGVVEGYRSHSGASG